MVAGPNSTFYLVGGDTQEQSVYVFIPGVIHSEIGKLAFPRLGHSACWFKDKYIFISGGLDSASTAEVFDTVSSECITIQDMLVDRRYHSSIGLGDSVYVFCGVDCNG